MAVQSRGGDNWVDPYWQNPANYEWTKQWRGQGYWPDPHDDRLERL